MSLFSFFHSRETAPGKSGMFAGAWRRGDLAIFPIGDHSHVVHRRDRPPMVFPAFAIEFALGCVEFKPLAAHVDFHAEYFALGSSQMEALRSWLPQLIEAGVLVSTEHLQRQCRSAGSPSSPAPALRLIGIAAAGRRRA